MQMDHDDQFSLVSEIPGATLSMQQEAGAAVEEQNHQLEAVHLNDDSLSIFFDSVLGQGSYGTVFLGLCTLLEEPLVAVKQIASDGQANHRVANEILIMQDLAKHPNIMSCYGYTLSPGFINIVMEHAPLGALSGILKHEQLMLPPALMVTWQRDIAYALRFLHIHNIKHKDIKAQNILVFDMFHIKLGDFGFAKEHLGNSNSTTGGGSLAFMAPEVKDGYPSSFASDIFSFGMTL